MCAVGPIVIGTSSDIYQYANKLVVDGIFDLTGGALTGQATGQLIQQFQAPHGPVCGLYIKEVESAALSGATSTVGTNFIPAGSMPLFISLYNTVLITQAAGTTYTAGDGTTADLFGTSLPHTVGDTANKWKTATSPKWYASATGLTLTGTGGDFTAGKVRAAMLYMSRGALLS